MERNCPCCQHEITLKCFWGWELAGDELNCPGCGVLLVIEYDEWVAEDYSDSWDQMWLEVVK